MEYKENKENLAEFDTQLDLKPIVFRSVIQIIIMIIYWNLPIGAIKLTN